MRYGWLLVACLAVVGCKDKGDPADKAPASASAKSAAAKSAASKGTPAKATAPASKAAAKAPASVAAPALKAPKVAVAVAPAQGGDLPAASVALSGAHTVGFFSIERPHTFIGQLDKVLANLPAKVKADLPELLRDPAGRPAVLGFDPTTEAGWRSAGLDPNGGVGLVFDDRVPAPVFFAKVSDRAALLKTLGRLGEAPTLGAEANGLTPLTMAGKTGFLATRGGYTLLLSPEFAELHRAGFEQIAKADAPLAESSVLKRAFSDGVRSLWISGFVNSGVLARFAAKAQPADAQLIQFYAERFEALSMSMGQGGGSFRLLGSAKGVAALRQLFSPMGAVPAFAKHIKADRAVFRFDLNLAQFFDGLLALMPESMAQPRSMVLMGKNALPMAIGVSLEQLSQALTGHFAASMSAKGTPGQPPIPVFMAGVKDGKQTDAVLKTITDLLKQRGPMPIAPGKVGGRDGYVLDGPLKMAVVRTDELLLAGPLPEVEAALAETTGLPSGVATMVDGLNMFGMFISFDGLLASMGQGPAAADIAAMIPAAKAAWGEYLVDGFLSTRWLVDGRGLQLGQGPTSMAIPGILAAVAIPAFVKYVRRSKTSEAFVNVMKMSDSAMAYYVEEHADRSGKVLPKAFPKTTPRTPAKPACEAGASVKHAPKAGDWAHEGWQALNFELSDPYYYQYEFVADAKSFTARAIGDLDCDGVLSTFERVGRVNAQGEIQRLPIRRINELE